MDKVYIVIGEDTSTQTSLTYVLDVFTERRFARYYCETLGGGPWEACGDDMYVNKAGTEVVSISVRTVYDSCFTEQEIAVMDEQDTLSRLV